MINRKIIMIAVTITAIIIVPVCLIPYDPNIVRGIDKSDLPAVIIGIDKPDGATNYGSLTLKLRDGNLWTESGFNNSFVSSIIASRQIGDTIQ